MKFRIDCLWAFLAIDRDNEEGVCAHLMGEVWMPMIGADEKRLEQLRPLAEAIAKTSGKRIKLVRFIRGQVVEEFVG